MSAMAHTIAINKKLAHWLTVMEFLILLYLKNIIKVTQLNTTKDARGNEIA